MLYSYCIICVCACVCLWSTVLRGFHPILMKRSGCCSGLRKESTYFGILVYGTSNTFPPLFLFRYLSLRLCSCSISSSVFLVQPYSSEWCLFVSNVIVYQILAIVFPAGAQSPSLPYLFSPFLSLSFQLFLNPLTSVFTVSPTLKNLSLYSSLGFFLFFSSLDLNFVFMFLCQLPLLCALLLSSC